MKQLTTLLASVALLSSLTGCCCLWPLFNGCGTGCGTGGGGYGCNNGCQPGFSAPPAYAPQGTYQSYDSVTGLPVTNATAYQPVMAAPAVTLGPMEALPTYR